MQGDGIKPLFIAQKYCVYSFCQDIFSFSISHINLITLLKVYHPQAKEAGGLYAFPVAVRGGRC